MVVEIGIEKRRVERDRRSTGLDVWLLIDKYFYVMLPGP